MSAMKALLPEAVFLEGADALELASCLALCGAFAGNNSGPLHLACALGVPSLSTSGPTDRSRFDPMGEDCLVLDAADFGPGREIGQIPEEAFAEALSPIVARAKTLEERFRLAGGG
jgi:ADP-heptose:LPS heptosyltransferase